MLKILSVRAEDNKLNFIFLSDFYFPLYFIGLRVRG